VRTDLKPLHITQPEGASFTVEGAELKWQNWTMRLGFNYREGPVIYQVTFDDRGTVRDIAYRLSFAEMIVPTVTRPSTTTGAPPTTSANGAWES
jgi:Cu2+-containing amine oxidase